MTTKVKAGVIADGAVGTTQLAGDSVTAGKIVDGAVGAAEIDAAAVGTSELADGGVEADDLAATLDLSSKTLTLPAANRPRIVQVVNTQTGVMATGSTVLPVDDTIPQNTEGNEYMTLAITPTSATNKLKIDAVWTGSSSALAQVTLALFQDATANALAVTSIRIEAASAQTTLTLTHYMDAGTTSATTFKVRVGPSVAATLTFNGGAGVRRFGGVSASSITITEIRV